MNKGNYERYTVKITNILIALGVVVFYVVLYYIDIPRKEKLYWSAGMLITFLLYLIIKLRITKFEGRRSGTLNYKKIRSLALLNTQGEILKEWDIFGKTGLLIGKSSGNHLADIDLSFTSDAAFISKEHAVLNYFNENWYIEDAGSKNGIQIKKTGQDRVLLVTESKPIRLDLGDMIKINETALLVR